MRIILTCTCVEYKSKNDNITENTEYQLSENCDTLIYSFEGHNGKMIYNSFSKVLQFMPGDIVAVDIKKLEKEE